MGRPERDTGVAADATGSAGHGPSLGWRAREIEEELPELRLLTAEVQVARSEPLTGVSPPDIQARMREMSNRIRGGRAVALRREPVPAAYRVFFRHIGMDPDVQRTPIESAVLERMLRGGFPTGGLLQDVLLIALIDTGVPIWALDSASLDGPLGIRTSREGESLGRSEGAQELVGGRLVVADASAALAILFRQVAPEHAPGARTARLQLFAIQVPGVPTLYAEEALWSARTALEHAR